MPDKHPGESTRLQSKKKFLDTRIKRCQQILNSSQLLRCSVVATGIRNGEVFTEIIMFENDGINEVPTQEVKKFFGEICDKAVGEKFKLG